MVFWQNLRASTVRSNRMWTVCLLAMVSMVLMTSCGGGGGGGDSSSATTIPSTPTTLFATSDSHSVSLAKISGTRIEAHTLDSVEMEVHSATATLNSDNSFAMAFSLYPGGGATGFSAIGRVDATGNSATATISQPGAPNFQINLTKTTSSLAGGYYGTYSGSSSGTFVAGVDGNGKVVGFSGSDRDGWASFSTTLSGSSFSATESNGTVVSGSISGSVASGTWRNTAFGQSGTFSGPKVF